MHIFVEMNYSLASKETCNNRSRIVGGTRSRFLVFTISNSVDIMVVTVISLISLSTNLVEFKRYPLSWLIEHVEKRKALSKFAGVRSVGFDAIMYWSLKGQVAPSGDSPSCFSIPRLKNIDN